MDESESSVDAEPGKSSALKSDKAELQWFHYLGDFANIFKGFIGTNYLASAFAFSQAGVALGLIGFTFIACLANHCCLLLLECKYQLVAELTEECSDHYHSQREKHKRDIDEKIEKFNKRLLHYMSYEDIGRRVLGRAGAFVINLCLVITQAGYCINYAIFIGNTIHSMLLGENPAVPPTSNNSNSTVTMDVLSEELTMNEIITTEASPANTSVPPLAVLVLIPLPFFIAFALIRHVRHMSIISVVANTAAMVGFFGVVFYLIQDFKVGEFAWFNWRQFPSAMAMVMSAFEAIGIILPVEASMEGNQKNFPAYLHGSVGLLGVMSCTIGVLGYIHFGAETEQLIVLNLPTGSIVSILTNSVLLLCILCTYPLQIVPVITVLESLIFSSSKREEDQSLLSTNEEYQHSFETSVATNISSEVPQWKRNVFRILLSVVIVGLSVVFRNVFAYVSGFVGALGAAPLAFIIPCLCHIIMMRAVLPLWVIIKDITIIIFGACLCVIGLIFVIAGMAQRI